MPFFEAVRCHPQDCAGDLHSTLLTLATVSYDEAAKKVADDGVIERGRSTNWQRRLGPKRAVPAILQTIRPPSLAAYGADISANANTTNHPTMTRAVTAPAITFSFSFVV
jgi:hypothetical protein